MGFYILPESCQPILDRYKVTQLQIILIDKEDTSVLNPVKMIDTDDLKGEFRFETASIIQLFPNNFKGLGKMEDYHVQSYYDEKNKMCGSSPKISSLSNTG